MDDDLKKELLEDQAVENKNQFDVEREKIFAISLYQLRNLAGESWGTLLELINNKMETAKQICVESREVEADLARGGYLWLKELLDTIDFNIERGQELAEEKANRSDSE